MGIGENNGDRENNGDKNNGDRKIMGIKNNGDRLLYNHKNTIHIQSNPNPVKIPPCSKNC